jgi:hypothetical protein
VSASATKPLTKVYRLRICRVDPSNGADEIRHLRALLKVLLRKYRFRVVEIEQEQGALTAAHSARFDRVAS